MPHVVAAPDKYRGTLSALDASKAVARAAADAGWSCDVAPMSDGREGFLESFGGFGRYQSTRVTGPLGARLEVRWLLGRDSDDPNLSVAVVESALAIGLSLAGGAEANDPVRASSAGLGQLVVAAAKAGAKQVLSA